MTRGIRYRERVTQEPSSDTAAPVCYRHPDRHTLLTCSRCERPICASCSTDAAVGQRCPECLSQEGVQRVVPNPIRQSRSRSAPATMVFLGLAVVTFFATGMGSLENDITFHLAQWNRAVDAGEWWRIFTPVLLHASLTHLLFNMWALWVLGPQIERGVGTMPFAALYVAAAGLGGAFTYFTGDLDVVAVGASGAIFGLFGVWASWALHRRNTAYGQALLRQIGFLLLINAAIPLIVPGVAWQAHLGGLVAGFVIGEIWARTRGRNAVAQRTIAALAVALLAAASVLL